MKVLKLWQSGSRIQTFLWDVVKILFLYLGGNIRDGRHRPSKKMVKKKKEFLGEMPYFVHGSLKCLFRSTSHIKYFFE